MSTPGKSVGPVRVENNYTEQEFGHPRGTLAIVIIFGSLFLLGWLGMYVFMFLQRGVPHP